MRLVLVWLLWLLYCLDVCTFGIVVNKICRAEHCHVFKIVANSFLASPHTSATFATILVGYLLERLEDMGTPGERANLYLKLFKVIVQ